MENYKAGLVSIILPIYNVEKYLSKCIDSCSYQTYKNIELILVDDGSTDSSSAICDEYKLKDSRINVIHQKNAGLSAARNSGIKAANGDWIVFVDSDDMINCNMVEVLMSHAVKNNLAMAWCGILEIDDDSKLLIDENHKEFYKSLGIKTELPLDGVNDFTFESINNCEEKVFDKVEAEAQFYTMGGMQNALVAWNKLYHRSLFLLDSEEAIFYPVGKIFEDGFTTYRLIYESEKIAFINAPLYYYRQRGGSIMKENANVNFNHAIDAGIERLDFYKSKNEKELFKLELNYTIYSPIRFYEIMDKRKILSKEDKVSLRNYYKIIYNNYFKKSKWPLAKRIRIGSFGISYNLYKLISAFEKTYNNIKK